ncbi:MAG: hypothetical protein AB8B82_12230 [Roseovarius sp.]
MIDLATILGSRINTSALINDLYIPANSIAERLQSFSEPALFHTNGMGQYHLSKSGSLTKIKAANRYFALITQHQLKAADYEYEQLCIFGSSPGRLVTSQSAIFSTDEAEQTDFDCVIFEFTEGVQSGLIDSGGWYNLGLELSDEYTPKPLIVCAIGYPGYRNNFDYENYVYPVSPNAIWGNECNTKVHARLAFEPHSPVDYDPIGMSGCPVFGIKLAENSVEVFLAGILTNASNKILHFLPRKRITSALHPRLIDK